MEFAASEKAANRVIKILGKRIDALEEKVEKLDKNVQGVLEQMADQLNRIESLVK